MLQDEQDWKNILKDHPFSWANLELQPERGALRPSSGQGVPFLGCALCLHLHSIAEDSEVGSEGAQCHLVLGARAEEAG